MLILNLLPQVLTQTLISIFFFFCKNKQTKVTKGIRHQDLHQIATCHPLIGASHCLHSAE